MTMLFNLSLALGLLALPMTTAYPALFAAEKATTCIDHPARGYFMHGAPGANRTESMTFVVTSAADNFTTATVCPGLTYNVLVNLTAIAPLCHYLFTSSTPGSQVVAADGSNGCQSTDCPNRYCVPSGGTVGAQTIQVTLPCTTSDTQAVFKVTMAANAADAYKWNTVTLDYATSGCPDLATLNCTIPPSSPPPSPSLSPPPPPPEDDLTMKLTPSTLSLNVNPTKPSQKKRGSVAVTFQNIEPDDDQLVLQVTVPVAMKNVVSCTPSPVDMVQARATVTCGVKSGVNVTKLVTGKVGVKPKGRRAKATLTVNVRP